MEPFIKTLLYIHIIFGGVSLIAGAIPMVAEKGGRLHRNAGKIFYLSMMLVSAPAFIISIYKKLDFLLAISVFSFYMNYTGLRVLKNREVKFKWFDWLAVIASVGVAGYMFSTGHIVLLVFGSILTMFIIQDIRINLKNNESLKEAWRLRVLTHIGRMCGTYIATVTAFLVVNINFVKPGWILWLLPTAIGTVIITYFTATWTKKLKPAR